MVQYLLEKALIIEVKEVWSLLFELLLHRYLASGDYNCLKLSR